MTVINNKQQQMIDFETSWYTLGGGSSREITEQFGLTDRDFFAQVDQLVDEAPPSGLSNSELRRMRQVIRRRLWMAR
ncbi:hypothetical protein GOPIP_091_00500 [Gordonia polyisoprenivorans NBRC 16320 = JCM 10675]|nr:hypothetical protein GOPIP_091_00500 [Gordonia polyisoprenivorans NBRC 16320 = JCM 10675]